MLNEINSGLIIHEIKAIPISFPIAKKNRVQLGIGNSIKNDAVIIKVTTKNGITGWGEAHHGRCPGAIAHLVNTTIKLLIEDKNANDIVDIWQRIYHNQLASHGMGTAACLALSGLDLALWDIRGHELTTITHFETSGTASCRQLHTLIHLSP